MIWHLSKKTNKTNEMCIHTWDLCAPKMSTRERLSAIRYKGCLKVKSISLSAKSAPCGLCHLWFPDCTDAAVTRGTHQLLHWVFIIVQFAVQLDCVHITAKVKVLKTASVGWRRSSNAAASTAFIWHKKILHSDSLRKLDLIWKLHTERVRKALIKSSSKCVWKWAAPLNFWR